MKGADRPFGDPRRYHGVPMEGWFWRVTDRERRAVAVALTAVNRDREGRTWGMAALALHPGGAVAEVVGTEAWADPRGTALRLGTVLSADEHGVRADFGDGSKLELRIEDGVRWPRRLFGGAGPGHFVPGLGQYWHPWLLGGRARGAISVGGRTVDLSGATVYAEKNWGSGFPPAGWWWGQAQGFAERDDACVAFAGGSVHGVRAGAVVVRLGDELIHVVRPPLPLRARADPAAWSIRARTPRHRVEIEGRAHHPPFVLPVPVPAERRAVHGPSKQHLAGELRVAVRRGSRTVFEGTSTLAGLEYGERA